MKKLIPLFLFVVCWLDAKAALDIDISNTDPVGVNRYVTWANPALSGRPEYGYSAYDAVMLYRLTGNLAWCADAVSRVESNVNAANAKIASGQAPDVAFDTYLYVGQNIANLSTTYQYCPQVTAEQKTRWGSYAEQTVFNVWNPSQASWNGKPFPRESIWGINQPGNNYHYSFLRATMMWGLAGNPNWIDWLKTNKLPQLKAYYEASGPGGGSREGTGYGMAHEVLFGLIDLWKSNTGEDLNTVHPRDSIDYLIHSTLPDFRRYAPIGDQPIDGSPALYARHRCYMLAAQKLSPPEYVARGNWWLNRITPTAVSGEYTRCDIFQRPTNEQAPTALYHYSPGAGHLFARDNWTSDAMWLSFVAGRYDESHAAQDQGSFQLYQGDFLALSGNMFSKSGIVQSSSAQNMVRFERSGVVIPQRRGRVTTMTVTPGSNWAITAEANLSPMYNTTDGINWSRKLSAANKQVEITDALSLASGTTAIWQLNTPVEPIRVNDTTYKAGDLTITVLAPAQPQIGVVDWKTVSSEYTKGYRFEIRNVTTEARVLLAAAATVTPPVEEPQEPDVPVPPALHVYPGHVMKATGTCNNGLSWHYQCGVRWVDASTVLPTDLIAICKTPASETNCPNPSGGRTWRTRSLVLPTDYVATCSALPTNATSKDSCVLPLQFRLVTESYVPPPPVTAWFQNVTSQVIDVAPQVYFHFWAGFPDVNGDGCLDAFLSGHTDNNSRMYIQPVVDGKCSGKFEHYRPADQTYAQEGDPRITSRNLFGNWYGNPDGLWSMTGQDVDNGNAAKYVITGLNGDKPVYAPKTIGCRASRCIPADLDGDGVVELVTRTSILKIDGTPAFALPENFNTGSMAVIFDINNDGYPDIANVKERGYYTYNPASKLIEWHADIFPATDMDPLTSTGHVVVFDYDNDGDLDLYAGQPHYSPVGADTVVAVHGPNEFYPHLFRNDGGTFTNVTAQAGLSAPGLIKNQYYFTTYTATQSIDIDNDGDTDLVMGGETEGDTPTSTTVPLIINNGDGTFKVDRTTKFGGFKPSTNNSSRPWVGVGDYDNDGRVDIVKTHGYSSATHESIAIYHNNIQNDNKWLRVRVQGATTDGLQSRVVLSSNGKIIGSQYIGATTSQHTNLIPHFGVGTASSVDVTVYRPHGGPVLTFNNVTTNQDIIISKGGNLRSYTPGQPLIVPDPVEPPPEEPDLTYEELLQIIEELRANVQALRDEKAELAELNAQQAADIAGLNEQVVSVNVRLLTTQEALVRAEQAATALQGELTTATQRIINLTRPITIRVTETGVEIGE